ncbi:MAG: sodium/proline symporter PutP [Kistimonas sp.]|nr:sodium/proline symporter PutP [Kistimonas sp.]
METHTSLILAVFAVYMAGMLLIGLWAWKRTSGSADYFLGGRALGPWAAALSAGASDMSGWLLLGLPGYAFAAGMEAFWLAGGLLAGTWLNWLLLAKRLRVYSVIVDNALTLPSYFANRFRDPSKALPLVSAFFILLFFLFYTGAALVAGGKLFETVFGLDYTWAVIIGALSVISYTLFGGFLAVCWTDVVQGLLMLAAMLVVPVLALQMTGSQEPLTAQLKAINPELLTMMTSMTGEPLGLVAILSLVTWGLGYFGQPHILARFAGIASIDDVPSARRIAVTWSALSMLGSVMVGLIGLVYVHNTNLTLGDGETIFMVLVNALFHPLIAGVLLAAILAAIMSTADSQLLVSSSALAEDFYRGLLKKDASEKAVMGVGRLGVIGIALIALLLAMDPESSVLELVSYAWAGFGAAFGPVLIFSLYWKRMNRQGALAGMLTGGATVILWQQVSGGLFDLYEIVPGFLFSCIAIVVISLMSAAPSARVCSDFDKMKSSLH